MKKHDWTGVKFGKNEGITGEITIKENGRKIDFFMFNDNNGYKRIISILKKYRFDPPAIKIDDELEFLNSKEFNGN